MRLGGGNRARRFEEGVYRDMATLRVSPLGLERLRRFSPIVDAAAVRTMGEPDRDSWRVVTVPIESVEHAATEMLRLGPEAIVLEPAPLRAALRDMATQMLAAYRESETVMSAAGRHGRKALARKRKAV